MSPAVIGEGSGRVHVHISHNREHTYGGCEDNPCTEKRMNSRAAPQLRVTASSRECVLVIVLVGFFLAVTVTISARYPRVWGDEAQCAEPAASLYFSGAYVSGAHPYVDRHHLFPDVAPLFSLSLFAWLNVFGFGITAVRSFNYTIAAAIALVIWLGMARHGLVTRPGVRLAVVALLLTGAPLGRVYWNNRYGSTGILILALMFLTLSVRSTIRRRAAIAACAVALAFAGLHMIPYVGVLALLVLVVRGPGAWGDLATAALAGAIGLGSLWGFWYLQGAWGQMVHGIAHHVSLGPSTSSIVERVREAIATTQQRTNVLLAGGLLVAGLLPRVWRDTVARRAVAAGLSAAVAIPLVMTLAGRFTIGYAWMPFLPLAVCCGMVLDRMATVRPVKYACVALFALCGAMGMVRPVAVSALEWNERDYSGVEDFVSRHVAEGESVYSCFTAYYPAKREAGTLWTGTGLRSMTDEDRQSVSLLIAHAEKQPALQDLSCPEAIEVLGGDWERVGTYYAARGELRKRIPPPPKEPYVYHLEAYRRVSPRPTDRSE